MIGKDTKELLADALVETEELNNPLPLSKKFKVQLLQLFNKRNALLSGGSLIIASFLANVLNYIFNAYLGRILTFTDFALISLIGSFFSIASVFFGAYATTVNYRSGYLIGKYGDAAGYSFWEYMRKRILPLSFVIMGIWLLVTPLLMNFFHTDTVFLFLLFSVILLVGFTSNINQGFLFAKMMFGSLAILSLIDPIVKLTATFILVSLGLKVWTFAAIPTSACIVFFTTWILIKKQIIRTKSTAPVSEVHTYSKKFFYVALLAGFTSIAYFTLDIILAKHYLTPAQTGEYALITLVGKMIFFLGNLTSPFIIPLISRYEGAKKNSLHALYLIILCTAFFAGFGFIIFGVFSQFSVPLLYGAKARAIVPYLPFYTFGMLCYTVSNVLVNYYLVRKVYTFTIATSLLILFQVGLIMFFHDSVQTIALVMSFVLAANLILAIIMHFNIHLIKKIEKSRKLSYLYEEVK